LTGGRSGIKTGSKIPKSKILVKTPLFIGCIMLAFKRDDFMNCLSAYKVHEAESNKNFIKKIPLFQNKNIDVINTYCEISVYAKGDVIIKDGDEPECLYMIK